MTLFPWHDPLTADTSSGPSVNVSGVKIDDVPLSGYSIGPEGLNISFTSPFNNNQDAPGTISLSVTKGGSIAGIEQGL
jgi:hypothetical protein